MRRAAARMVAALHRAAPRLLAVVAYAQLAVVGLALLAGAVDPALAFEGTVTLPDGTPAADATVVVVGHPGTSRTDADGRFVWQPDPTPPFMILVVLADGRVAPPVPFTALPAGEPLAVRIEPGLSESVTVAAGAAPHIEAPPAAARTLVAREDLAQRRPQRLADILENLPNTGRLEEGSSVVPSIRGLARGRTLLLIDGARVTAERRAGPSATYLDPEILESTEITRGPGSVAFGSDAFGGVIDARTRSAPHDAPWSGRFDGTIGAGWPEAAGRIEVQRGFGTGGFLLSAHDRDLGDYDSPEGEVPDSAAEDRGFLLRGTHEAGKGLLGLGWQTDSGTDIGKPSQDSATTSSIYPRETSNRFTASWDIDPRGGFTEAGVETFLGDYRVVLERDRVADATNPRTVSSSDVTARDFGVRAYAGRTLGPGTLRFGLDVNGRFDLHATGEVETLDAAGDLLTRTAETSIENARRTDTGLFGIVEQPMGSRVTGSVGLRADHVTTENSGGYYGDRSTSNGDWAGHAAVTVRLPQRVGVTLQAARGFRDPTLSDRYYVGISGRGFVTGNPDLEPETALQYDVALTWEIGKVVMALYGYDYTIDDLIERYEPAPGQFAFRNRGQADIRGIELEAHATLAPGLRMDVALGGASGRADDGSPLADIPPFAGSLVLRREIGTRGYVMVRAAATTRDDEPGPTETTTPGYALFDAGGGWRPESWLELRLLVRNLADKAYPATPDSSAALAPGRTAQIIMSITF